MRTVSQALAVAVLLVAGAAHATATVLIFNGDPAGQGFNDPTVVAPVGGNSGTTLGAQRLAVFQEAARIWGAALDSPVPITVLAHFTPLTCDSTGAVLGSAGPTNFLASDPPLDGGVPAPTDGGVPNSIFPKQATWYVEAMVERFLGKPLLTPGGTDQANYAIVANFNSTLDTDPASCNGFVWYYGLDNQHGNKLDLLTVVLHEFGHGLGFITVTNKSTGEFEGGLPDVWASFLYDEATSSHWTELDAAGRMASVTSQGLSWDGPAVKAAVPTTLLPALIVRVTSAPATPAVVKDYTQLTVAQFSAEIGTSPISGDLGVGSTQWGCTALGKLAPLDGQIAILDRGGPNDAGVCSFVEKARNAQDAGAIALLVANNTTGLITPSGTAPDITIPVLLLTQDDGQTLKNAVAAGPVAGSLLRDAAAGLQGADRSNRALLYAPPALVQGSSVSHWDTSAFPNLLMEPNINGDLNHTLDLTIPLFRDIGWFDAVSDAGTGGGGGSDAGTGGGGGGKSGCSASSGPPAPWLALLGLLAFARRRRRA